MYIYIYIQSTRIFLKHVISIIPIEIKSVLIKCTDNYNITFDFADTLARNSFLKNLKDYIYEM